MGLLCNLKGVWLHGAYTDCRLIDVTVGFGLIHCSEVAPRFDRPSRLGINQNGIQVLRDAATLYIVDVDAIGLKVRQEFPAKEKAKSGKNHSRSQHLKSQRRLHKFHHSERACLPAGSHFL